MIDSVCACACHQIQFVGIVVTKATKYRLQIKMAGWRTKFLFSENENVFPIRTCLRCVGQKLYTRKISINNKNVKNHSKYTFVIHRKLEIQMEKFSFVFISEFLMRNV